MFSLWPPLRRMLMRSGTTGAQLFDISAYYFLPLVYMFFFVVFIVNIYIHVRESYCR